MKHVNYKNYICLLLTILLSSSISAQVFDEVLSSDLQNRLDQFRNQRNFMGISAAIVSYDYGIWTGVSGFSEDYSNNLITPEMIFGIGSVTKTYIATLIMQLEEEKILSIDDSIYNWLPNYPNIDSTITLKQLLKHESGLFNLTDNPRFIEVLNQNPLHIWQDEEIILELVEKALFQPGESYSYSNTNYILLGMILKKAGGKSISTLLRERILNPLNLAHTYLAIEDSLKDNVAHGWLDVDGDSNLEDFTNYLQADAFYSALWTAGAMYSTAEDAALFMKALFDGKLVSKESLEKMMDINSASRNGLGLFGFTTPDNISMIGHDGFTLEYSAFVYYDVKSKSTFSLLVNQRDLDQHSMILIFDFIKILNDFTTTSVALKTSSPSNFVLDQNWPNPFNPSTNISFTLQEANNIQLNIYNIHGAKVRTLFSKNISAGKHTIIWNGENDFGNSVASGIYIYRLQVGQFAETKQMVLIR